MLKKTILQHEGLLAIFALVLIATFVPLMISAANTVAVVAGVGILIAYAYWIVQYAKRVFNSLDKVENTTDE